MAQDEEAIAKTLRDYVQSFQSLQVGAVVSYFQVPFVFISDQGVRVLADTGALETFLRQVMESLKARAFSRSEITDMRVNRMSAGVALVSVRRIRYKSDGSELERLGETYTFRRVDHDWKIAAAMVHDPGVILTVA
jgi:ketosteroid isomerase-like protein